MDNIHKRIVLKFGTSLLTGGTNELSREVMASLTSQVAKLHSRGLETVIVTSGAAPSRVAKRVIRAGAEGMSEKIANGGFETAGDAERPAASWGRARS